MSSARRQFDYDLRLNPALSTAFPPAARIPSGSSLVEANEICSAKAIAQCVKNHQEFALKDEDLSEGERRAVKQATDIQRMKSKKPVDEAELRDHIDQIGRYLRTATEDVLAAEEWIFTGSMHPEDD